MKTAVVNGKILTPGLYYTLVSQDGERTTAYLYSNPDFFAHQEKPREPHKDYSALGFGLNIADGGGFLWIDEVSKSTDICMTFGQAIEAMRQGHKVARAEWSRKGMWCHYESPEPGIAPMLTRRGEKGTLCYNWIANSEDTLADDWNVISGGVAG
ncbi:Thoeris anti-defense Tad2 family protein [Vibrio sp. ER1A]|uniref:Thoeris anti-defense Tad2 family protein n=1 Tax=Vibrio sp. ER1A TaxID=1517681 RepID=UPI000B187039|nr:MW1434 family type I TA system toxin [Vibrio sp. ER1A]